MQRSRAGADEAALLLAGLALRELEPGCGSPGRGRRGPRPGPGDEAAPALGRRGKGSGGPEAGADGLSRGERGPRRAAVPELSAQPAGSPRASLAGSDGGGGGSASASGGSASARSSGISLGYDQRHGSPRSGRSDLRPGPRPPSVGSARSSVSSLGSRGSAGAYADFLPPGACPAPARSPEPAGPAPFPLPALPLPPGREGGPSAAERRLEALTRELERALEARTARDYFGERARPGSSLRARLGSGVPRLPRAFASSVGLASTEPSRRARQWGVFITLTASPVTRVEGADSWKHGSIPGPQRSRDPSQPSPLQGDDSVGRRSTTWVRKCTARRTSCTPGSSRRPTNAACVDISSWK
ncbi:Wilms tumor protein 1-interacting protein isoform X4 [Gorilla gorilla gorilla]|uniref:Wilms tumor protein 1-interacting protein isoform X4 n=1 Tax=Gorilla gorilla gorilla TaxID=9595 RepID=UPI00300A58C7